MISKARNVSIGSHRGALCFAGVPVPFRSPRRRGPALLKQSSNATVIQPIFRSSCLCGGHLG